MKPPTSVSVAPPATADPPDVLRQSASEVDVLTTRPVESPEHQPKAQGDGEGGARFSEIPTTISTSVSTPAVDGRAPLGDASLEEGDLWGFLVLRIGCVTLWLTDYPLRHFLLIIGLVVIYALWWSGGWFYFFRFAMEHEEDIRLLVVSESAFVIWTPPFLMLLIGLGSLCAPPLWWGIRCVIYCSIVLIIVIYFLFRQQLNPLHKELFYWDGGRPNESGDPLATLAWVAGAVLLQFALFVVLSEPRVARASTSPTGGREIDVDHNRLSCRCRRAGWRPSATAERIAKARQTEPFLYRSVVKRWLKGMDYLTFIRLYKLLAVVGMAVDLITDAAVGVEISSWFQYDPWPRAFAICGYPKYPLSDDDEECVATTRSRLESEAQDLREEQGYLVVGSVILGLSLADFVSLFIHYGIRGSPSLCQHIWIVAFALLEVPILVLTIVWATEASNPMLFIVSAFFTLVTVSWRVGSFAWTIYVRWKNGTSATNTNHKVMRRRASGRRE
ncbi:unnamed protein product [Vitrella brassicaformis CCMP3155]|uniref:Transmembrane protein n=1 Tax=Vitrella brassicaformis (strain CCMP3155) TaxID=1169540 RepID=A0A0G4FHF8_VITBC|nr:unnamed protein product [Vitrella brassicaformis CCMP3155]|eukprot:CEM12944.1 unnamed protein product [Vitrella brassicaformis CCMP3155]